MTAGHKPEPMPRFATMPFANAAQRHLALGTVRRILAAGLVEHPQEWEGRAAAQHSIAAIAGVLPTF